MATLPGKGRGCVSNNNGKPTTATSNSTTAPIKRRRACVRATRSAPGSPTPRSGLSAPPSASDLGRKKGKRMKGKVPGR